MKCLLGGKHHFIIKDSSLTYYYIMPNRKNFEEGDSTGQGKCLRFLSLSLSKLVFAIEKSLSINIIIHIK